MRLLYVRLRQDDVGALVKLAQTERRHPSDQAALIIEKALRQAGQGASDPARDCETSHA